MSATVTCFLAHSIQIEPGHDPHKWIVDSAANAYITSFKNTLHNYVEFPQVKTVKGFGGKQENAYGQGSIILTDSRGNEQWQYPSLKLSNWLLSAINYSF